MRPHHHHCGWPFEFAGRRHGRGFGRFMGGFMGGFGPDGPGFRTGRKLGGDELQLLLLALLEEKPSHGYELIKLLADRSGGFYSPSPGMVYPALTYLEEVGYASVETEGAKKLYRLTPEGAAYLDEHRDSAKAMLAQLDAIKQRMGDVRRAFSGEDTEVGDDDIDSADIRQAARALKQALREKRRATPEEQRRVIEILRRAAEEIREPKQ
ncbi:helix-turn-helix transcriptional regulator [Rhodoblastus sp.]|uniref:helix-turn-helix transcriptional regulator n=1 Tax=Rhodoblastus sp. TaxID=1962975 RepID=UPI0035AD989D